MSTLIERELDMKELGIIVLFWIFTFGIVLADEGMWPPEQLPELEKELRKLGLEIDPEKYGGDIDNWM